MCCPHVLSSDPDVVLANYDGLVKVLANHVAVYIIDYYCCSIIIINIISYVVVFRPNRVCRYGCAGGLDHKR